MKKLILHELSSKGFQSSDVRFFFAMDPTVVYSKFLDPFRHVVSARAPAQQGRQDHSFSFWCANIIEHRHDDVWGSYLFSLTPIIPHVLLLRNAVQHGEDSPCEAEHIIQVLGLPVLRM